MKPATKGPRKMRREEGFAFRREVGSLANNFPEERRTEKKAKVKK